MNFQIRHCFPQPCQALPLAAWLLIAGLSTGCDPDIRVDVDRVVGPNTIIGSGRVISESRSVGGFHGVSLLGVGRLIVDRNGFDSVTLTADDNLLPHLTSDVMGGLLELGVTPGRSISTNREILYEVSARTFDELWISGAGNVEAMGIDSANFRTTISGAGNVTAYGEADRQDITISGAGRYDAEGVLSHNVTIVVSGAGFARLRVSGELDVTVLGAGTVEYYGDPMVRVTGDGSVRRMGS